MTNEQIARVVHEANRAYCAATGDNSQAAWDDAPEWQRASAVEGIQKAKDGATPEQLHESWCAFKIADGWTHGDVKDAEAKTHPCLVAYADLPAEQRVKDHLFRAVVEACTPPMTKTRAMYMHTLDRQPAVFEQSWGGPRICFATGRTRVRLVGSLTQIRREQGLSRQNDRTGVAWTYGYALVEVPR